MRGELGGVGGAKGRREAERGRERERKKKKKKGEGEETLRGEWGGEKKEKREEGEGVISPSLRCSLIPKILPHAPNIALLFLT